MSRELPDNNILITDYIQEVYVLSEEVMRMIDEITSIVKEKRLGMEGVFNFPNSDKFFYVEPRIFPRISAALVHSANIKKMLFATNKKRQEAKYKYEYRSKREDELNNYFSLDKLVEIKKSQTRNSLEHYDDRLDNISYKLWEGSISGEYDVIANNMVLSSEGALIGNPFYLKCYVIDDMIYKNHETEANLKSLYNEAKMLKNEAQVALGTTPPYSGTVIPIPPRNDS